MMVGAAQPEGAEKLSLVHYFAALQRRDRSMVAWEKFLADWDALLCPASMTTAFAHRKPGTPIEVDGGEVDYFMVSAHSTLFNYSGHPALVLPCATGQGMPIGVQLVGRRWSELRLLAIAAAMTPLTGGFRRPPGY